MGSIPQPSSVGDNSGDKPPTQAQLRRERRALLALDVRCVGQPLYTVPSQSHPGHRHTVNVEADSCTCAQYRQSRCWHRLAVAAWLEARHEEQLAEIARLVAAMGPERALARLRLERVIRAVPEELGGSPGWRAHYARNGRDEGEQSA